MGSVARSEKTEEMEEMGGRRSDVRGNEGNESGWEERGAQETGAQETGARRRLEEELEEGRGSKECMDRAIVEASIGDYKTENASRLVSK